MNERPNAPSVDVVIVNWNAGRQLRTCLESLVSARRPGFLLRQVAVVDNGSSDGSANDLGDLDLPLTIIRNKNNLGFAAACNQAAAHSGADYLLFLNPDTRVMEDSISRPIRFLEQGENQRTGIVGVQLLNDRGEVTPTCARFLTPGMIFRKMIGLEYFPRTPWKPHFMVDWDHQTNRKVDHVMGAFFLVRTKLFQQLGRFDERFFVYLEDLDFSLRATRAGFDTFFLADTRIYHTGGGASRQIKATSLYYSLTSRILYGYKHFNGWTAGLLALGTLLVEPFSRIGLALARRSPAQVADTLKAYALLWRALPRVLTVSGRPDTV
jgi:N-acetylglucosaminyl-diphospho-decaprenol L-rhamnosyltransferase